MIRPAVTIEPIEIAGESRLKITIDMPRDVVILYVADDTLGALEQAITRHRAGLAKATA